MKLSEAIILGSVSTIQRFDDQSVNKEQGLCVIQTALHAIGSFHPPDIYNDLWDIWPWVTKEEVIHPITGQLSSITRIMYTLNDRYKWPRPRIAEWIKTIEPNEVTVPATQESTFAKAIR